MTGTARPPSGVDASGPFQLFPALSAEAFAALKADIAERGVLVPVEVDELGQVIDGHHRVRAWSELRAEGVSVPAYPRVVRVLGSDDARVRHALTLNLARRHLSPGERAELVRDLAARGVSGRRIAGLLGVAETTVRRDLAGAPNGAPGEPSVADQQPTVVGADGKRYRARPPASILARSDREERRARQALDGMGERAPAGLVPLNRAEQRAREQLLERRRSSATPASSAGDGWELRCADFREVALDDASVDVVIVDPPYVASFDDSWDDLGAWAASVLRPGRVLVSYCGHLNQDRVMAALGRHLSYVWVGVTVQHGRHNRVHARMVHSSNRPWLVYAAGDFRPLGWMQDTLVSEGRGERSVSDHPWRQALGPFVTLVETFSRPGELVVDPCCGQGTTGVAALRAGRRFLGVDIDPAAIELSAEALDQECSQPSEGAS